MQLRMLMRHCFFSVIQNLLFKYIKFTNKEGVIVFRGVLFCDKEVKISIADNGVGMKEEDLKSSV